MHKHKFIPSLKPIPSDPQAPEQSNFMLKDMGAANDESVTSSRRLRQIQKVDPSPKVVQQLRAKLVVILAAMGISNEKSED